MKMNIDKTGLDKGMSDFNKRTLQALGIYGDSVGKKLETHAKQHRKWQDRTGQARQRLFYTSEMKGSINKVAISHGVDYGVHLELANERKNAILLETVETISPQAVQGFKELFK